MTRDIDLGVDGTDLQEIRDAVRSVGLGYRQVAGEDMLFDSSNPARSTVHLILDAVPEFSTAVKTSEGVLLALVADRKLRQRLVEIRATA